MEKERIGWIDNLRAFGMIFVVWGHTKPNGIILAYLYTFAMPLFFVLSGMLTSGKIVNLRFRDFFIDRVKRILSPYFAFGLLTYLLWLAGIRSAVFEQVDPITPLKGMLIGYAHDNWMVHAPALWFFVCLFITQLYFFLILKLGKAAGVVTVMVSILGVWYNQTVGVILPWYADAALITVGFYGIGYFGKQQLMKMPKSWATGLAWLAVLAGLTWLSNELLAPMKIDVRNHRFDNGLLSFVTAMIPVLFWIVISKLLPPWEFMKRVSESTIVIFPLHGRFLVGVALVILATKPEVLSAATPVWLGLSLTAITIAILVWLTPIIERVAPWSLGRYGDRVRKEP